MYRLIRWYNQNREKIWIAILVMFVVIVFIQVINHFYENKESEISETVVSPSTKDTINNNISGKLEGTGSLVNGYNHVNKNLEKHTLTIDTFIKHCNSGQVEEAYEFLTDECKEELFPNLDSFKNKYYNNIFNTYKTYSIQNWIGNTYKVKLTEDALSTGKISSSHGYLQEHITIVEKNSEYKLNINNYIGREEIDKTSTVKGITINIQSKETYMDFSEYTIKIQNTTENTILLDEGKRADNIYLLDENNVKEYASTGEIIYSNLKLLPRETKKYTFKFSNSYSNKRVMRSFVLNKVIMNYDEYNEAIDKNQYNNFEKVTVAL